MEKKLDTDILEQTKSLSHDKGMLELFVSSVCSRYTLFPTKGLLDCRSGAASFHGPWAACFSPYLREGFVQTYENLCPICRGEIDTLLKELK